MNEHLTVIVTAGLVATACGLLGPFLVLRRVALMSDAVSHAVLPGIVAVFLLFRTRAPLYVIVGAALFAIICVLGVDALCATGRVGNDAAICTVFPALFALGVLGVHTYAENIHLDLDATIYGEIAFAPFRMMRIAEFAVARSVLLMGAVALANLLLVALLWKELKVTSFDAGFSRVAGFAPGLVSRVLLVAAAVTAVTAFESVGAILVVTMLIVPAAAACLLTDRLVLVLVYAVAIGWIAAGVGYASALHADLSIAGAMGVVATSCFLVALLGAPRHGLIARAASRARRRRAVSAAVYAAAGPGSRFAATTRH